MAPPATLHMFCQHVALVTGSRGYTVYVCGALRANRGTYPYIHLRVASLPMIGRVDMCAQFDMFVIPFVPEHMLGVNFAFNM